MLYLLHGFQVKKEDVMFFVFSDSLKIWKKDLKASGADMSVVKNWQKVFDRVKRETPQTQMQYIDIKKKLEFVYTLLRNTEMALIEYKRSSLPDRFLKRKLLQFYTGLKKYQGAFQHEFLISEEDTEFQLTYQILLEICEGEEFCFIFEDTDTLQIEQEISTSLLIIQSEIENLMAITLEALEKESPQFRALTFYYFERDDTELVNLPHLDKIDMVNHIYEEEFLKPMRQIMTNCYGEEKANRILEVDVWI